MVVTHRASGCVEFDSISLVLLSAEVKDVLLISPYFLPSNLAGVHRVRLMSRGLASQGWKPTIVTVDAAHYEEASDPPLLRLLADGIRIESVSAWPSRLCRPLGFGDISLRGQWAMRRRVRELVREIRPSLIFATVLPGYTALVGSWAKRHFNIPFILDYQDPWVASGPNASLLSKAGLASRIALWLEPKVLPWVDALTAVSDDTLNSLRSRNLIRPSVPVEIIPIGADPNDHKIAAQHGSSLIKRSEDTFHVAYLGTLTDRMLPALRALLHAVANARGANERKIVLHLIGTSARPDGEDQHNLKALVLEAGLEGSVHLHPARVGYLDALRTMQEADLLLLIGSTDSHYTASKLFPYWLSGKPIMGLFHKDSTIVNLTQELGGAALVLYNELGGPETRIRETTAVLTGIINGDGTIPARDENSFDAYASEGVASRYASLFDKISRKCA